MGRSTDEWPSAMTHSLFCYRFPAWQRWERRELHLSGDRVRIQATPGLLPLPYLHPYVSHRHHVRKLILRTRPIERPHQQPPFQ